MHLPHFFWFTIVGLQAVENREQHALDRGCGETTLMIHDRDMDPQQKSESAVQFQVGQNACLQWHGHEWPISGT